MLPVALPPPERPAIIQTAADALRYGTFPFPFRLLTGAAIVATGGTISDVGGYRIHKFTASGTFQITAGSGAIEYLVVAGGGGGGGYLGGGGGGGGLLAGSVSRGVGSYTVTVGSGGTPGASAGGALAGQGGNSVFDTVTATGGGGGYGTGGNGQAGGSGGGAGSAGANSYTGGAGIAGQGHAGGNNSSASPNYGCGGGGGATAVGGNGTATVGGAGGNGTASSITGSSVTYAGGGGAGVYQGGTAGAGGTGGGGAGGAGGANSPGVAGAANTGGGGGGASVQSAGAAGGAGGSGVVIVRYPHVVVPTLGNDSYTKVLLHFDDLTSPTAIDDPASGQTRHPWTATSATISTAQSKFGGSSLDCTGGSKYVDTPNSNDFILGTSDFTIDCWVKSNVDGTVKYIAGQADASSASQAWIGLSSGNLALFNVPGIGQITGVTQITVAKGWTHIAAVRTGSTFKLFVDGVHEGTDLTSAASLATRTDNYAVGRLGAYTTGSWNGYIDEFRLSIGIARWTANFTPPAVSYTQDGFTRILLHFDGANGSTVITESAGRNWTNHTGSNSAVQSKFGGSSYNCGAATGWVDTPDSADFTLGSGDFTIDCWFYRSGGDGAQRFICGQSNSDASSRSIDIQLYTNNKLYVMVQPGSIQIISTTIFTAIGWHHVAVVRTGNTLKMFIDGVQEGGDVAFNGAVTDSVGTFAVGMLGGYTVTLYPWNGYIDEFRLSVGIARWTANFTPPTSAYS